MSKSDDSFESVLFARGIFWVERFPGAGYVIAPFMYIYNSDLDPNGVASPSLTSGMILAPGSPPLVFNGFTCPTDSISVFGATTGNAWVCKFMV